MKSIYLISGEVSGDTHGAELMQAISDELAESGGVKFSGAGGPLMKQVGDKSGSMRDWVEKAAVMGVVEVLKHYRWFKTQFFTMLEEIKEQKPDALVLIDYPGFNIRMATAVREAMPDIKIIYYR